MSSPWLDALRATGAGVTAIILGSLLVAAIPLIVSALLDGAQQLAPRRVLARTRSRHPYR